MSHFLDTYDHSKLNQEDINQFKSSITHNQIGTKVVPQYRKF
jgi:hypothetical protein